MGLTSGFFCFRSFIFQPKPCNSFLSFPYTNPFHSIELPPHALHIIMRSIILYFVYNTNFSHSQAVYPTSYMFYHWHEDGGPLYERVPVHSRVTEFNQILLRVSYDTSYILRSSINRYHHIYLEPVFIPVHHIQFGAFRQHCCSNIQSSPVCNSSLQQYNNSSINICRSKTNGKAYFEENIQGIYISEHATLLLLLLVVPENMQSETSLNPPQTKTGRTAACDCCCFTVTSLPALHLEPLRPCRKEDTRYYSYYKQTTKYKGASWHAHCFTQMGVYSSYAVSLELRRQTRIKQKKTIHNIRRDLNHGWMLRSMKKQSLFLCLLSSRQGQARIVVYEDMTDKPNTKYI